MGGSSSTWRRPRLIYHGGDGCGQMPRCNSLAGAAWVEFRTRKGLAAYRSGNATIIPSSDHWPPANRSQLFDDIIKIVSHRSHWSVFARQPVSDGVYDLRRPLCARGRGIAMFGPPRQRARRLPSAPGRALTPRPRPTPLPEHGSPSSRSTGRRRCQDRHRDARHRHRFHHRPHAICGSRPPWWRIAGRGGADSADDF